MDLNDTAHYCRQEIQRARIEMEEAAAMRAARPGGLSKRELDVLQLLAAGLTTREIAEGLYISAKTADRHIQNLYTKIDVSNRAGGDAMGGRARPGRVITLVHRREPSRTLARPMEGESMDHLHALDYGLDQLREVVGTLAGSELERTSNCEPWTVRRLASHALNNQLLWAGLVTGEQFVSVEDTMGAVPLEGDLTPIADAIVERATSSWRTDGVLDVTHVTPFGELPGSVVILFAIIDAVAHAWDLSASVGRPIGFDAAELPWIVDVVAATCTDAAREHGLIKPPAEVPTDATATEQLMAAAGRRVMRPPLDR